MSSDMGNASDEEPFPPRPVGVELGDLSKIRWQHTLDAISKLPRARNSGGLDVNSSCFPKEPPPGWEIRLVIDQHGTRFSYSGWATF